MLQEFVHLHLHSEYSLSDGIIRIEELISKASGQDFSAVALTDINNLFGLIKFYRLARTAGIKPIVGSEVKVSTDKDSQPGNLVLLVKNKTGYTNLTKLVSKGYVDGQESGEPIIKFEWLEEFSEGLIALSGGMNGHIGQSILSDNLKLANTRAEYFKNIFGDDFFIEIQRVGKQNERAYNEQVLNIAHELELPLVATNDVRFLMPIDPDISPSDFEAHEARVCIQKGYTLDDKRRSRDYSENQYFRSIEEMNELFLDLPEALSNTARIAEKCNLDLELGKFY